MYIYRVRGYMASLFAVIIMFFGQISFAQAELISNNEIDAQKEEVLHAIVITLQEHLKLLQMDFIQRLEARVEYLQTLADAK